MKHKTENHAHTMELFNFASVMFHSPSDPVEQEDDFLALRRDVSRKLEDPLVLVVLHI